MWYRWTGTFSPWGTGITRITRVKHKMLRLRVNSWQPKKSQMQERRTWRSNSTICFASSTSRLAKFFSSWGINTFWTRFQWLAPLFFTSRKMISISLELMTRQGWSHVCFGLMTSIIAGDRPATDRMILGHGCMSKMSRLETASQFWARSSTIRIKYSSMSTNSELSRSWMRRCYSTNRQ